MPYKFHNNHRIIPPFTKLGALKPKRISGIQPEVLPTPQTGATSVATTSVNIARGVARWSAGLSDSDRGRRAVGPLMLPELYSGGHR